MIKYNLKVASGSWLDMQDAGHEAVVAYRKCPATQQIRSNSSHRVSEKPVFLKKDIETTLIFC
jgi:hypothetical protein